jgi:(p)ppGpp synthase/HD superfamily hydrolase
LAQILFLNSTPVDHYIATIGIFVQQKTTTIMNALNNLKNLVLAPYILKATALIGVQRKVGGNQFRHSFATLGILLDYKIYNPVLLKAALLHDIVEDYPEVDLDEIRCLDHDGPDVVQLVLEVTRNGCEKKSEYLFRLLDSGSYQAMVLKCTDRISNLTDLHRDTHTCQKISEYLDQTEQYVIPMAQKVNTDMVKELGDLVKKRRRLLEKGECID